MVLNITVSNFIAALLMEQHSIKFNTSGLQS